MTSIRAYFVLSIYLPTQLRQMSICTPSAESGEHYYLDYVCSIGL